LEITLKFYTSSVALSIALATSIPAMAAKTPSMEEMWNLIQQQQQTLEKQKQEIARLKNTSQTNEEKIEATTVALEESDKSYGKAKEWFNKTSIGGYGELHYNNLDNKKEGGSDKKEMDLHRFVLFFGHEFNDNLRFFSEFEIEHDIAGDGKNGEVEVEQAYVEYDFNENHSGKAGVFLMPFGIVNETHEPPTFYGTERNPVEKNIIPATWWEGGLGLSSHFENGISTDVSLTSGLYLTAGKDFKIRNGRQKVSEAKADSGALAGRVKYTGVQGLELSISGYYQDDYNQGETNNSDSLTGFSTHAIYAMNDFTVKALYASWDLSGDSAKTIGADTQKGWYIEPSYKISEKWGVFARYNEWDNAAGASNDTEYTQTDFGVNYWLDEDVVLKADYQDQDAPKGKDEFDGFNLGVGYQF
jgi:hypothetical protein